METILKTTKITKSVTKSHIIIFSYAQNLGFKSLFGQRSFNRAFRSGIAFIISNNGSKTFIL